MSYKIERTYGDITDISTACFSDSSDDYLGQSQSSGSNESRGQSNRTIEIYRGAFGSVTQPSKNKPELQVIPEFQIDTRTQPTQRSILEFLSKQKYDYLKMLERENLQNSPEESKSQLPYPLSLNGENFISVEQDSNSLFRCLALICRGNHDYYTEIKLSINKILDKNQNLLVNEIFNDDEFNRLKQIVKDKNSRGELIHALLYCFEYKYALKILCLNNEDHDLIQKDDQFKHKVWLQISQSVYFVIVEPIKVCLMSAEPYVALRINGEYVNQVNESIDMLKLNKEEDKIMQSIKYSKKDVKIQLIHCTKQNLEEACKSSPKILHLSGHGVNTNYYSSKFNELYNKQVRISSQNFLAESKDYRLYLEDETGIAKELKVDQVEHIFKEVKETIELVILMSCHSGFLAEMLIQQKKAEHVICVLGTAGIANKAAEEFSEIFYKHLFAGKTICLAFDDARKELIRLSNLTASQKKEFQKILIVNSNKHDKSSCYPIGCLQDGELTIQRSFEYTKQSVLLSKSVDTQIAKEIQQIIDALSKKEKSKILWVQIPSNFKNQADTKVDEFETTDYSLDWVVNIQMSACIEEHYNKYHREEFRVIRLQVAGYLDFSDWLDMFQRELNQEQVGEKQKLTEEQLKEMQVLIIIAYSYNENQNQFYSQLIEFLKFVTSQDSKTKALVTITVLNHFEKICEKDHDYLINVLTLQKPKKPKGDFFNQMEENKELKGSQLHWFMQVEKYIDVEATGKCICKDGHELECISSQQKSFEFECQKCLCEFQINYFCMKSKLFQITQSKAKILQLKRCYKCGFHSQANQDECKKCRYNFEICACCDCKTRFPIEADQEDYQIIPDQPIKNYKFWQTTEQSRGLQFYYTQRCSGVDILRYDQQFPFKRESFRWGNHIVGVRVNSNGGYQFIMSNGQRKLFSDSKSSKKYNNYDLPGEITKVEIRYHKRDAQLCGLNFWCTGRAKPIAVGDFLSNEAESNYGLRELELEKGERLIGVRSYGRDIMKAQHYSFQFIVGRFTN